MNNALPFLIILLLLGGCQSAREASGTGTQTTEQQKKSGNGEHPTDSDDDSNKIYFP